MNTQTLLSILFAYLLGSIPFTVIVAQLKGGVDLRDSGSRNVGARNLARHFGWGWGSFGALLDFGKGTAAVLIAKSLFDQGSPELYYSAVAAVAGHNWPVYLRFHGGKGLATAGGAILAIAPWAAVVGVTSAAIVLFGLKHPMGSGLTGFIGSLVAIPLFGYAQSAFWATLALLWVALLAVLQEKFTSRNPGTD